MLTFLLLTAQLFVQAAVADPTKIALLLDKGGKDDKSFNAAAYHGALDAKAKLGVYLKTIEASDDSFFEPAMRSFIAKKFDLIVGIGVVQAETIKKLAAEFPQQKFAIIDSAIQAPNVSSSLFGEHEGSYLVGYIAGMKSKSGHVGFIGGMDIPLIRRFEKAFAQGAKAARAHAKVEVNYVGATSDAWNNPTKAKELAENQYSKGVDIIFIAAGASNNGCLDAAERTGKFAIGVDSNQNGVKPGRILTSMLKRVDVAVYNTVEDVIKNRFKGGVQIAGLKAGGVDWALDQNNQKLFTPDELKKITQVKQDIINRKIKVIDYYK